MVSEVSEPTVVARAGDASFWIESARPRRGGAGVRGVAYGVVSLVLVVGVWWLVSALDVWSDLILPSPAKVWARVRRTR